MYEKTTSSIKTGDTYISPSVAVKRGVRQGDTLSPTLFNIFVNDLIPHFLEPDSMPPKLIDTVMGCLLYADDLVILSTTAEGLQTSLNKLETFCNKWKLNINRDKSKVMKFSKGGTRKRPNPTFRVGEEPIEITKKYTYLGVEISDNGSFKGAQQALYKKALRALFKLKGMVGGANLLPQVTLRLFDQLIKPIALYGSEIWGHETISTKNPEKFLDSLSNPVCEKLNLSLCRFALGLHRKTQISATRGELGRLPLGIDIVANMITHHDYLKSKDEASILGEAQKLSEQLAEQNRNNLRLRENKIAFIKDTLSETNTRHTTPLGTRINKRKTISDTLGQLYVDEWRKKITKENKLRTYVQVKTSFSKEDYLNIKDFKLRRAMARLRTSAHNLAIERGRYTRPPTPVEERVCTTCPNRPVEDEYHFLMTCINYDEERLKMQQEVTKMCPNFINLSNRDKFIYLLTAGTEVARPVARFIEKHLP